MQVRICVPMVLGLLIAVCHSPVAAQINCGYYRAGASQPTLEPYYNPEGLTTGCFRDPEPCWLGQATFDILLLDRSDADSRTIVTDFPSGDPELNTTDLGFPVTAGFRFNLVLTGDDGCDFVFNYLGTKFINARTHYKSTARFDFFESAALEPETSSTFQTSYMSTLNSVEINSRTRQWSRFAPLAGLRFISLEDQFDRLTGDASADLSTSKANNGLFGFQIGGEGLLWETGPALIQSTVKGGVFYNNLTLQTGGVDITITDLATMTTTTFDPAAKFSSDHISFFGEVNIEFAYRICSQVTIRAGYTAMWLDGVALAPDQHDNFNLQTGIGDFDFGTVMYHGSYVGAELTW